jgi:hypothetical protein
MDKLIELAESLNVARYAANDIKATAPQSDAYGSIAEALVKVLVHIVGGEEEAQRVYEFLIETDEPIRRCLVAGYGVEARSIGNSWKVTDPDGETIGRIYLNGYGRYSPERAIDRVIAIQPTLDAAVFALVQDFRHS